MIYIGFDKDSQQEFTWGMSHDVSSFRSEHLKRLSMEALS